MTKEKEKTEEMRKELDKLAESMFPELSAPQLVNAARAFECTLN